MSPNEELAREILLAYADGKVDLTNVPALQARLDAAVSDRLSQLTAADQAAFHDRQEEALAHEKAWYHQEINRILNERLNQISPAEQKKALLHDIAQRQTKLNATEARITALNVKSDQLAQQLRPGRVALCYVATGLVALVPYVLIFGLLWRLFMN